MTSIKMLFISFFLTVFFIQLHSQNNLQPIRIEERGVKYKETNSKYGTQVRTKKQLVIVYDDDNFEVATISKLTTIFKQIPLAGLEYKNYKKNNLMMSASMPLFVVGFWGAVNTIYSQDKEKNALIGILGLATGVSVYEVFEYRKKRNINRLIAHCNNYWKNNVPQSEIKNTISPDVIRFGLLNDNSIGIGLVWYISE